VFAPVAAALCTGTPLAELGDALDPAGLLPGVLPVARFDDDDLVCEVLWVDRFGNAQLNVDPDELESLVGADEPVEIEVGGTVRVANRVDTYARVGAGSVGLVVDSYGLVSVALDRASAAGDLGLSPSVEVRLRAVADDGEGAGGRSGGVSVAVGMPGRRS
jgi:S-adenosylmethionine hydrolase